MVGLERNQFLLGLLKKLEVWDAVSGRPLLRLHLIDKCCYEISYELNNRPAWVGVPMAGLISLAGER